MSSGAMNSQYFTPVQRRVLRVQAALLRNIGFESVFGHFCAWLYWT